MKSPRHLETNFRQELGKISPYLSMIDIASSELVSQENGSEIMRLAKKHKHKNLVVDYLDLQKINFFVYLAHIAFIHSRAEGFCDKFRIYQKEQDNDDSSPNLEGLDKLRRTIFYLHTNKVAEDLLVDKFDDHVYAKYAGQLELKIVDYYRKIRNVELHNGIEDSFDQMDFTTVELESIKSKYSYKPRIASKLTMRDVILFSMAWQNISVSLCRWLVDIDTEVKRLCKKYKANTYERRDNAISKTLRNDYLQDESEISKLKEQTNGWVA